MTHENPNSNSAAYRHREDAPSRFYSILESTTDLVLMADREGNSLYLNRAGRQMLGLPEHGTLRIPMTDIFPAWAYAILMEHGMPEAYSRGSWSGETAIHTLDGSEIPVLQVLLAHTGDDGQVEFFSTICRDISERKQKELEQIEWSNRYDAAIRASGRVLFDWDSNSGRIQLAGAVQRLTGFESATLNTLDALKAQIHAEDLSDFDVELRRVMATHEQLQHEFRFIRKDGREITMKADGYFFVDRDGRIGRMVGFLSDVTAEKLFERAVQLSHDRLEQSVAERTRELEEANAALIESARKQEAVARLGQRALGGLRLHELLLEAVGLVKSVLAVDFVGINEWLPDIQGFRSRAAIGWPESLIDCVIPGGTLSQSGYTLQAGRPVVSSNYANETRFTPSASCRVAGVYCGVTAPIQAGERPYGVLAAFSSTKRAFAQDDISFLQGVANIISAVIERLRVEDQARRAQAAAEEANRAKSEFLSRMSHELRTPLNAVLGFTQLLELDEHTERQAESIRHISQAGRSLLELINEVLDIARIDSRRAEFSSEPVEIAPLLSEILMHFESHAARNRISLRMVNSEGEEAVAHTDRVRLTQIFQNLISNAVKYNRPEGSVTIAVARCEESFWKISVTDTGPGITPENLGRLFVPFERLGQKEGGTAGGTGLGLALCQRLAKALDARIGVASTPGTGTTFWIDVPAEKKPISTIPMQTDDLTLFDRNDTARTILYIEDDLANHHLTERIVGTREGLRLVAAAQGTNAAEIARQCRPALILLDLNLPDVPGERVIEQLKSDPETREIPVVLVTGDVVSERAQTVLRLGAAEVLSKPYRIQDFLRVLDTYLKK